MKKRVFSIIALIILVLSYTIPAKASNDGEYLDNNGKLTPAEVKEALKLNNGEAAPAPSKGNITPEEQKEEDEYWKEENYALKSERDIMMRMVFADGLREFKLQEDRFEGEFTEIKGEDGSVTKIYSNGSMETAWPDGTREGLDAEGNHYTEDKDGRQTVTAPGGSVAIEDDDGSFHVDKPDGSKVQVREDGSSTLKTSGGVVIDYDEDGERTAIGFEGGEKLSLVNGMFPPGKGEITGPDGAMLKWNNETTAKLNSSRYSFEVTDKNGTVGKAEYDPFTDLQVDIEKTKELRSKGQETGFANKSYTAIRADGLSGSSYQCKIDNTNSNYFDFKYTGADGTSISEIVTADSRQMSIIYPDGSGKELKGEGEEGVLIETDADGQRTETIIQEAEDGTLTFTHQDGTVETAPDGTEIYRYKDGTIITCTPDGVIKTQKPDGKVLIMNLDNKMLEYRDTNGQSFMRDAEGRLIAAHLKNADGSFMDFADGKGSFTDASGKTVAAWEADESGKMKVLQANGGEITFDEYGRPLLDGNPLFTGEKGNTEAGSSEGMSASEVPGGEVPTKAEILGTYDCKLTLPNEDEQVDFEFPYVITDGGKGKIIITMIDASDTPEERPAITCTYDAATGTALGPYYYEDEALEIYEDYKIVFGKQSEKITMEWYFTSSWDGADSNSVIGVKR